MTLKWRRLAGCVAAAIVAGVAQSPGIAHAGTCERVVGISPQVSRGEGTGNLTFQVYSIGCAAAGEVTYAVEFGTASPADLELPGGRLQWTVGDTRTRQITALLRADPEEEPAVEDFTVRLFATTPTVRVAVATGHGRILDDDGPQPSSAVDDADCLTEEGRPKDCCETMQGMLKDKCVTFRLSIPADQSPAVTIRWSTVDGTARAGVDYVPVIDQTTTIPAGASHVALPVRVLSRPPGTPTRWFQVQISAMSWPIVDDEAVVRILGV
jgi:hypothetical protein